MTDLTLAAVDRDGALGEALADLHGDSRAGFLRKAFIGSGALLAAFATPASAARGKAQDISILNFALLLERLQAVFYTEVERNKVLHGGLERQARTVGAHERAHVTALAAALGSRAQKSPRFAFGGATEGPDAFRRTAVAFEDLAVAAYKGQAPRLDSKAFLAAALAIHSVEARHAAWIRLAGKSPVTGAFDEPKTRAQTTAIVAQTRFIMNTTSSHKGAPRFTG